MNKNKPLHVLINVEYFYPHIGGVERAFLEIGKNIVKQGQKVSVITTHEDSPYILPQRKCKRSLFAGYITVEDIFGMDVIRVKLPKIGRRYFYALMSLPVMILLCKDADIIHAGNNYTVSLPSFIFARLTNKPVTMTVWEIWDKLWFSFYSPLIGIFFWIYEKAILSLPFDKFITPSKFVYNQIPNIKKSHKTIIYPAGKSLHFNKNKRNTLRKEYNVENSFLYVYYGRFAPNKGVDILLASFKEVRKSIKHAKLFLFIPQPEQSITDKVEGLVKEYNLTSSVKLFDSIPEHDMQKLENTLSMADCVVIPDKTSAFGLSALESSEVGRPIVITTAGAFPEVVHGKVVFVKPSSEKELIEGMKKIYKKNWQNIPEKKFSWQNTAENYIAEFQKILSYRRITHTRGT